MEDNLKYILSLKDDFSKGIKEAQGHTANFEKGIGSLQAKMIDLGKQAAVAFAGFIAVGSIKELFNDAVNAEMSVKTLSLAVNNSGGLGSDLEELQKISSELSETGIFSAGTSRDAAKSMLNFGFSIEQVKKGLPVLEDMAASTNKSLEEVVQSVNMAAAGGRAMALKQFGLGHLELKKQFEDAADQAKGMKENLDAILSAGGQKYAGGNIDIRENTAFGQMEALKMEWHHLMVDIGKELIPVFRDAIPYIQEFMEEFKNGFHWIKENADWLKVLGQAVLYTAGAYYALKGIDLLLMGLTTAIEMATTAQIGLNVVLAINPFVLLAGGVAALILLYQDLGVEMNYRANEIAKQTSNAYLNGIKEEQKAVEDLTKIYKEKMNVSDEAARKKAIESETIATKKQLKDVQEQLASWDLSDSQVKGLNYRESILKGNLKGLADMSSSSKAKSLIKAGTEDLSSTSEPKASKIQNVTINMGGVTQDVKLTSNTIDMGIDQIANLFGQLLNKVVLDAGLIASEGS